MVGRPGEGLAQRREARGALGVAVGVPVERWLDRHGPRWVMTIGSVVAVLATFARAAAPTLAWFVAAWGLAGVAMAAVLYPPAFAALTAAAAAGAIISLGDIPRAAPASKELSAE